MSEFDPDNRAGAGGGAGFQTIHQGGNVSSRLPGRQVTTGGEGVASSGTTTVNNIRGSANKGSGGSESMAQARAREQGITFNEKLNPQGAAAPTGSFFSSGRNSAGLAVEFDGTRWSEIKQ